MRAAIVLLAALPLFCSAAAPFRIDVLKPNGPAPCNALSAAECEARSDHCSLCQNQLLPAVTVCLERGIADVIPSFIFKCSDTQPAQLGGRRSGPLVAEPESKPQPAPWEVCESFGPGRCKRNDDRCSLCTEKASGLELCFRPSVAAKLPPFIFDCSEVKAVSASAGKKPKPEPWTPCEAFNATECEAHSKECALCSVQGKKKGAKPMCFGLEIAEKLPPFIFHCKLPKGPDASVGLEQGGEAEQAGGLAAGAKPAWLPCESFNETECAAHKHECARCLVDGKKGEPAKPMCFSPVVAKFLPPTVFHCKLPKPDARPALLLRGAAAADPSLAAELASEPTGEQGGDQPQPAPWEVCEAFGPARCKENDDRCSLCTGPDGNRLCFSAKTAAKLPPFIFKCSPQHAEEAAGEGDTGPEAPPAPWVPCQMFNETECEAHKHECARCKVDGKKGKPAKPMCMDPKTASLLPPFIFHCQLPKGGAELAAEPESKPQPAPWEVCESFGPGRCRRNDDRCSLCTEKASGLELCFRPSVAAKLPPFVFECSAVKEGAAVDAAASAAADNHDDEEEGAGRAGPWVPCEAFAAAECAAHKECAPCFVAGDAEAPKPLCFGVEIAQALPPNVFHCKLPKEALPGDEA